MYCYQVLTSIVILIHDIFSGKARLSSKTPLSASNEQLRTVTVNFTISSNPAGSTYEQGTAPLVTHLVRRVAMISYGLICST